MGLGLRDHAGSSLRNTHIHVTDRQGAVSSQNAMATGLITCRVRLWAKGEAPGAYETGVKDLAASSAESTQQRGT